MACGLCVALPVVELSKLSFSSEPKAPKEATHLGGTSGKKRRRAPLLSIVIPDNKLDDALEEGAVKRGDACGRRDRFGGNSTSSGSGAGAEDDCDEQRPAKRAAFSKEGRNRLSEA